jgi:hypothetical protein
MCLYLRTRLPLDQLFAGSPKRYKCPSYNGGKNNSRKDEGPGA